MDRDEFGRETIANLIAEDTLMELGLRSERIKSNIVGIGETTVQTKGQIVLQLWHRTRNQPLIEATFIVLNLFHQQHPQKSLSHFMFPSIDEIDLADPEYNVI